MIETVFYFFSGNKGLKTTMSQTEDKQCVCEVCGKTITKKGGNLWSHMRVHSGDKPFKCKVCDKEFIQSSNLKRHLLIHTGDKLFTCELCSKEFFDAGRLKTHVDSCWKQAIQM